MLVKKKKIGRNDPCHCGSGKKYKKCCYLKDYKNRRSILVSPRAELYENNRQKFKAIQRNHEHLLMVLERRVMKIYRDTPSMTGYDTIHAYKALKERISGEKQETRPDTELINKTAKKIYDSLASFIFQQFQKEGEPPIESFNDPRINTRNLKVYRDCLMVLVDSARYWTRRSGSTGYLDYVGNFV
ncbi:MAG: SEC-C metal-binding domain-containing protein [Promethearchaeota archaeon]